MSVSFSMKMRLDHEDWSFAIGGASAGKRSNYGLSFRKANRKYEVPRHVQKERLEIFWVTLFTIRFFISRVLGYDPIIVNFDQSPFHNNETGSQDKPTLNLRSVKVPVIEGNSDVKTRWTANLPDPQSRLSQENEQKPFHEMMFKAADDGTVNARLQKFIRSRGFPSTISVTVAPKGSYRSQDVIQFLSTHLDEWREGRDWRILLADDASAHRTETPNTLHGPEVTFLLSMVVARRLLPKHATPTSTNTFAKLMAFWRHSS